MSTAKNVIFNRTLTHRQVIGRDIYGKPQLGPGVTVACAIVKDVFRNDITTVRTDSSATRSFAEEQNRMMIVLVPFASGVDSGDRLTVNGTELKVAGIHQRFDVFGKPDHLEVTATAAL